jgi:hypothetical protein
MTSRLWRRISVDAAEITNLESARMWALEHDTIIQGWWEAQHEWNARIDNKLKIIANRMTSVERRNIFLAGMASALGIIGTTVAIAVGIITVLKT